jgi:hypothetical protein
VWWAHKATHTPRPFSDLLYVPIYFTPPVVPTSVKFQYLTQRNFIIVAWFHKNVYLSDEIWIQLRPHTHKGCARLFMLPYGTSDKYGCQLSITGLLLLAFAIFYSCIFLVVHISPTRTGESNSHHQQSLTRVESVHTTGCCPVPRRDRLRHCYHHLSVMQPSARCLTPWLQWTRTLFAVLGRYPLPRRGRLGLDFGSVPGKIGTNVIPKHSRQTKLNIIGL